MAGRKLTGRRILVFSEQGLGDAIQFSRFAGALAQRGDKITLLVPARLRALLSQLPSIEVVSEISDKEHFDVWAPLMSLPRYLNFTPDTVPPMTAPYLRADAARMERWDAHLKDAGFRVGICWQGNPDGSIDSGRSIPLDKFAVLAAVPGVRLISLQKGAGTEQISDVGFAVEHFAQMDDGADGFLDAAAIIACCDLVITSDTSIAHLAGALDKPTWLALKLVPDWRWLLKRTDTPWYPSLRLYRQQAVDDWDSVFNRMAVDLKERLSNPS